MYIGVVNDRANDSISEVQGYFLQAGLNLPTWTMREPMAFYANTCDSNYSRFVRVPRYYGAAQMGTILKYFPQSKSDSWYYFDQYYFLGHIEYAINYGIIGQNQLKEIFFILQQICF